MSKTTSWWRRLITRFSLRPDITDDQSPQFIEDAEWAVSDAWTDVGHALNAAIVSRGSLIKDGMGQLPDDADLMIDLKLRPDFNWAPLHGMDGVQIHAALKSFRPTSKAVRS